VGGWRLLYYDLFNYSIAVVLEVFTGNMSSYQDVCDLVPFLFDGIAAEFDESCY
jgi:hypothetical protein